jgi:hypothetical protein
VANWIKWRYGLSTSPHVLGLSRRLGIDMRIAASCYMEFVTWFDSQARNYEIKPLRIHVSRVDDLIRLPRGFFDAVLAEKLFKIQRGALVAIDRTWSGSGQWKRTGKQQVYFIRSSRSGLIKIGISSHPINRLRELRTSEPVELLGTLQGGRDKELALHKQFAEHRVHGEWFTPSPCLIEFIRSKGISV